MISPTWWVDDVSKKPTGRFWLDCVLEVQEEDESSYIQTKDITCSEHIQIATSELKLNFIILFHDSLSKSLK